MTKSLLQRYSEAEFTFSLVVVISALAIALLKTRVKPVYEFGKTIDLLDKSTSVPSGFEFNRRRIL